MKLSIFSKKSTARKIQMTVSRIIPKYLNISLVKYFEIIDIIEVVSVCYRENKELNFFTIKAKKSILTGRSFAVFARRYSPSPPMT